jgi:hypothetical protein
VLKNHQTRALVKNWYKLKINSEKNICDINNIGVLLIGCGCSNKKLIEPLVQIKGTYNYLYEVPKADSDLINTFID